MHECGPAVIYKIHQLSIVVCTKITLVAVPASFNPRTFQKYDETYPLITPFIGPPYSPRTNIGNQRTANPDPMLRCVIDGIYFSDRGHKNGIIKVATNITFLSSFRLGYDVEKTDNRIMGTRRTYYGWPACSLPKPVFLRRLGYSAKQLGIKRDNNLGTYQTGN